MLLIIVRHGEAEPKSTGKLDEDRELTSAGSVRLRHSLDQAKEIVGGGKLDFILSSPILRAKQSAQIAKEVFDLPKIEIDRALESESSPYDVYQSLLKFGKVERVLLVSHQPLVSHLLASLLSWDERYFSFHAGTIAMVSVKELRENPDGVLFCLLPSQS